MAEGASTLNARTVYEATQTLPNHTSMVTGRRVSAPDGGHGVTFNEDNGSTVHASAGEYAASIFDVVHDAGGRTALYSGKVKFDFLDRSWDGVFGAVDTTGVDNGRDVDTYLRADDATTTNALEASLTGATGRLQHDPLPRSRPDRPRAGLHVAGVPLRGHRDRRPDRGVADHDRQRPGARRAHRRPRDQRPRRSRHEPRRRDAAGQLPGAVLRLGVGVTPNSSLYALNPDRLDPGTGRPSYTAAVPPVRNGEVGNLAAELLGFGPIPDILLNSDQSLDLAS